MWLVVLVGIYFNQGVILSRGKNVKICVHIIIFYAMLSFNFRLGLYCQPS